MPTADTPHPLPTAPPPPQAAVIGDTVGDPLKDTSGPSLNILVKLMAVESLVSQHDVFEPREHALCFVTSRILLNSSGTALALLFKPLLNYITPRCHPNPSPPTPAPAGVCSILLQLRPRRGTHLPVLLLGASAADRVTKAAATAAPRLVLGGAM